MEAREIERESLDEIEELFDRLWPLLRSLTGPGVRATHDILAGLMPLERHEIPSGTRCFDWTVPPEWRPHRAYLLDPEGHKVLDLAENNLHLLNYSTPFRGSLSLEELREHLYSLPRLPEAIPYVTSYYHRTWGFCLPHRKLVSLKPGTYRVVIDTELVEGSLTLSDCLLPGASSREVLLTSYTCHPSLANNELGGMIVLAFLYRRLAQLSRRRYTYRFVLGPETLGSLLYLQEHGEYLRHHLVAGYVLQCLATDHPFHYKCSRPGRSLGDRAARHALAESGRPHRLLDWAPVGGDERQYGSPGFNLPVGSLMRLMYGEYPEYHTSLDDKSLVSMAAIRESIDAVWDILLCLEDNARYQAAVTRGEPMFSKYGLFPSHSWPDQDYDWQRALMWIVNLSDGEHDLMEISRRSRLPLARLRAAAELLVDKGLLEPLPLHGEEGQEDHA